MLGLDVRYAKDTVNEASIEVISVLLYLLRDGNGG